eukprot:5999719-Lingulodinium_polyedra.AAC.1
MAPLAPGSIAPLFVQAPLGALSAACASLHALCCATLLPGGSLDASGAARGGLAYPGLAGVQGGVAG